MRELPQIALARDLWRVTVQCTVIRCPAIFLQDAVVRGGGAARVVLRLQAVDGDHQVQAVERGPLRRDGPYGAGDELDLDPHAVEFWQQLVQLAVAHQGLAADDRNMYGAEVADNRHRALDEFAAAEIAQLTQ